jgi:hypothetical protein
VAAASALALGALSLALALTGCLRIGETDVRLRDPTGVALRVGPAEAPQERVPAGGPPQTVVVKDGTYGYLFSRLPYRVEARREPDGTLRLSCAACAAAPWPLTGRGEATLVDGAGRVRPTHLVPVRTPAELVLPYDIPLVRAPRRMQGLVEVRPRLAIPWDNVLVARRVSTPPRLWGAFATIVGAGWVTFGALAAANRLGPGLRVGLSVPLFVVGGGALGLGVWCLSAPAREEALVPPPP